MSGVVRVVASLPELADEINREHAATITAGESFAQHAHRCGVLLVEAKEQVSHGEWLPWLEENFAADERTARRYMQVANRTRVADLDDESLRGALRALEPNKLAVTQSSESDDWSTPDNLFRVLEEEFGFTLDVCATAENAKCETFYTVEEDGLAQPWTGSCWMNPPYGGVIGQWVEKAHETAKSGSGVVVALVPARVDTSWWWNHCIRYPIRFLPGRLRFGDGTGGAPFPSAVVVFSGEGQHPDESVWWDWRYDA